MLSQVLALTHIIVLLTRKADVQPLKWGYKFAREIARRMPHFRGEPPALHPDFPPGRPASIVAHAEGPIAFDAPHIVYSEDDDQVLEEFVRANGALLLSFPVTLKPLHYLLTSPISLVLGYSGLVGPPGELRSPLYSSGRR